MGTHSHTAFNFDYEKGRLTARYLVIYQQLEIAEGNINNLVSDIPPEAASKRFTTFLTTIGQAVTQTLKPLAEVKMAPQLQHFESIEQNSSVKITRYTEGMLFLISEVFKHFQERLLAASPGSINSINSQETKEVFENIASAFKEGFVSAAFESIQSANAMEEKNSNIQLGPEQAAITKKRYDVADSDDASLPPPPKRSKAIEGLEGRIIEEVREQEGSKGLFDCK